MKVNTKYKVGQKVIRFSVNSYITEETIAEVRVVNLRERAYVEYTFLNKSGSNKDKDKPLTERAEYLFATLDEFKEKFKTQIDYMKFTYKDYRGSDGTSMDAIGKKVRGDSENSLVPNFIPFPETSHSNSEGDLSSMDLLMIQTSS